MNKLERGNIDDIFALTPIQEGMLFHFLKEPGSDLYFEQLSLGLAGRIDIEIFERAWNVVVETNEMLRALFRWEKLKNPVQVILKRRKVPIHIHDFSAGERVQKKKAVEEIKIKDKQLKFDFRDVPFRVTLCKLGKAEYEIIISNHHILYDGWSLGIILKEFFAAYESLLLGVSPAPPVKTKFKRFIEWSRVRDTNKDREYWKEYLEGFGREERFPGRRKKRIIESTGNYRIKVPGDLKNTLEKFVKSHNITIAPLFYGVWGLLLHRYDSVDDVLFDTTVSGRRAKIDGIENIVGLFINTLPLRVRIHPHEKIADFLSRIYRMLQQWSEFESSSLLDINEYLDEQRKQGLFDSLLVIENYPLEKVFVQKNRALSVKCFSISGMTRYDLTVLVTVFDEIMLNFTYNKELFDEDITAKLAGDFIYIIKTIIEDSREEISGLMLLSGEVKAKLWERYMSNGVEYEGEGVVYTAPRDLLEERLAGIWAQLYGMDRSEIGIDMNFFDFGGHSLKASLLAAKIHREFNTRVPPVEIFRYPTIRELAGYIAQSLEDKYIPIKPTEAREYYRVSPAQKRLYMLHQLNPGSTVYNGPLIMILEGRVDRERLSQSFETLIQRHEMLRTFFEQHHGEPVQGIYEENSKFKIQNSKQITNYKLQIPGIIKNFLCPFDLSKAPLLRVGLIEIEEEKYLLMFDMHHIITDGTSIDILTRELTGLYNGEELPSLTIQYKDFSGWQNERLAAGSLNVHEDYWLDHLSGELPVLDMPTDFPRPMVQCFAGERVPFALDTGLTRRLHLLMKGTGTTLYMVLMSVYSILLGWYSGQDDILVGVPTAGRNHADLQDTVGLFLETLVTRNRPLGDKTFAYFLQEVRHNALTAQEHQDYPFSELVRQVGFARMNDLSRNPLFDVMLNVLNQNTGTLEMEGIKILPYGFDAKVSKVDITLEAVERANRVELELEYCTGLFKRETMECFIRHFLETLGEALDNPSIRLADMEIIPGEEKRQILEEFNNTGAEYVPGRTFMEYFERRVEKAPDAAAVTCSAQVVTYKELNKKSNQLACMLKERGVLADNIVGIMVPRSVEMIIGILGILKAGGAYLPIDPDYPRERIDYMLKDSGAKILLATGDTEAGGTRNPKGRRNPLCDIGIISWNKNKKLKESGTESTEVSPVFPAASSNLAYIIYTSGSTGRPRGVVVSRKNLAAYIRAFTREFEIKETDVVLQQASFCFDASVEEVFPCLVSGGTLALPSRDEVRDIALLCRFIVINKVSIIDCSPLLLNELNRQERAMSVGSDISPLRTIRTFISGGDVLKGEYTRNLLKIGRVYNTYGPTETTVCAAYHRLNGKEGPNIPIGRPITGYRVFIVDRDHRLLPIGITGEICISGVGITMGYLNRPELTAEKFISKSFSGGPGGRFFKKAPLAAGGKLYKTGDLGKWLFGGIIEFIGRKDVQVKIRGYRIEPGEIEAQLLAREDINEVVVIPIGNNVLCAYFTGRAQKTVKEMRDFLSKKLPGYMIPAYFVRLETFPLGPGGKINTRALPGPVGYGLDSGVEYVPPAGELEGRLVELWQELLGLERIGTADDFFDLGGDSILANRCIAAVREKLNVGIPLRQFFERPTIKALAEEIEISGQYPGAGSVSASAPAPAAISIEKAPGGVDIPLSFPQERLWFLQNLDPENRAYFVPRVFRIKGQLDVELLERTFTEIIRRHEILRTVFVAVDGKPVQRVRSPYRFKIPVIDRSRDEGPRQSREVGRWVKEEGRHPFDFEKGPLLRVTLLKLKEHEHLLVLTEHHLVHDGWTQGVLLKEFITIFSAYVEGREHGLPELPIQYADFAYWQRNYLQGEVLENQLNYWKQKLAGVVQVLELPGDRARPPVMSGRGALKDIHLSGALTQQLKDFSRKRGVTLFMTMLAVHFVRRRQGILRL
jgi:tyrocidine synthetase-3